MNSVSDILSKRFGRQHLWAPAADRTQPLWVLSMTLATPNVLSSGVLNAELSSIRAARLW